MEEEKNNYEEQDVPKPAAESEIPEMDTATEDKIFASLAYISLLFIVPLILKNENEEIHFHAKQGLVLFGAEVTVWFALFLLDTFLAIIFPNSELFLVQVLGALAWVGFMALSIAGVYAAARGKQWVMPIIGRVAQRIKV